MTREEIEAACATAVFLQHLDVCELVSLRQEGAGTIAPAFWHLAALHPTTIGRADRAGEWKAIVRTLAILTPAVKVGRRPLLHNPLRRFGTVLCDGGDEDWLAKGQGKARPVFSEMRFIQLLRAVGRQRASKLERGALTLSASMNPESGVNVADIGATLLSPQDTLRIAEPYYRCLDRAPTYTAHELSNGAAP